MDRGAEGRADRHEEPALVRLRRELRGQHAEKRHGHGADQRRGGEHRPAARERPGERRVVETLQPLEGVLEHPVHAPVLFLHVHVARAQHRRERERDEKGHQHPERHHHGERAQELPDDAGNEDHGREDRHQRHRGSDHREGHLAAAFHGGPHRVLDQVLAVAVDVLQDDDGVVHHDADEEQEREQRHRIEGVAEEVHDGNGAKERHRDRGGDDRRGAEAL